MKTKCPNCNSIFKVSDEHLNKNVNCPKCKQAFVITSINEKITENVCKEKENNVAKPQKEQMEKEKPAFLFGKKWEKIIEEVAELPPRDDQVYKGRAIRKGAFYTFISLVFTILGLLLIYIDIYTPARIPFGWLLGLFTAVVGGLFFIVSALGTIVITMKPTYVCDEYDVFDVVNKPLKVLGSNVESAIRKVEQLDTLSRHLVLPSQRNKLGDLLRVINKTLNGNLDKYQNSTYPNLKVIYSIGTGFMATPSSYRSDNIVCGVAKVEIKLPHPTQSKKVPYAEITLAAVKSSNENWYLALPDLDTPGSWIKFAKNNN